MSVGCPSLQANTAAPSSPTLLLRMMQLTSIGLPVVQQTAPPQQAAWLFSRMQLRMVGLLMLLQRIAPPLNSSETAPLRVAPPRMVTPSTTLDAVSLLWK